MKEEPRKEVRKGPISIKKRPILSASTSKTAIGEPIARSRFHMSMKKEHPS
jgi:hypothetical protein